jgi:predicted dithiol-disulfide oxidoreductase (DUF899 family)
MHDRHFPNEPADYRTARNAVLESEIALRHQSEAVAKMRRELPRGGRIKEDYIFESVWSGEKVKFSDLFSGAKKTMIVYSMMYAPEDTNACPMCTSIVDSLNGASPHVNDRMDLIVATKAPIEKARKWAEGRGWKNIRLFSTYNNSYTLDYFAEDAAGDQWPALNVFEKADDGIYHRYATELLFVKEEPGQNFRHVDSIWPIWNLFDFTPEGRGTNWYPKFSY